MIIPDSGQWQSINKSYLEKGLERIRTTLMHNAGIAGEKKSIKTQKNTAKQKKEPSNLHPALLTLATIFNLSTFEHDILLLCLGMELDKEFPNLCAAIHNNNAMNYPTFQLALTVLDEPHWSAITPTEALRYWKLLEVGGGPELTRCPLRLDEKILHYLMGVNHLDQRLGVLIEPQLNPKELAPSHKKQTEQMAAIWQQSASDLAPAFFLWGNQVEDKRGIAFQVSQILDLDMQIMSAHLLPTSAEDLDSLIRLWDREAILSGIILMLDCDEINNNDTSRERSINHLVESIEGFLIVSGRQRRRPPHRPFLSFDIEKPTPAEQYDLWRRLLGSGSSKLESIIERLTFQFNLSPSAIHSVSLATYTDSPQGQDIEGDRGTQLWNNCRLQARPRLEEMVQRIEPKAQWEDLVLPEKQLGILKDIAVHVRQRGRVYETWDFISRGSRGLGISALFAGSSGTGKTMAAEVLALELGLDLYRIDLSTVVSKYIGETEKNLRRVFDTAEEAGAILLFDEADALFGKRSEVKDSHDRYANIEISYLLQRMEEYRGLAILTTNLKEAMDKAFMRRLRFIVHFPFPGPAERATIWDKIFPEKTPRINLDIKKLARLNISGGHIRNVAINAAFYAAEENNPVSMGHLLRAATAEYNKLKKTLTEEEIKGWI